MGGSETTQLWKTAPLMQDVGIMAKNGEIPEPGEGAGGSKQEDRSGGVTERVEDAVRPETAEGADRDPTAGRSP